MVQKENVENELNNRPFKVLGIQQIAVGGLDKTRLRRLWVDTLGLDLVGSYQSASENVDEDIQLAVPDRSRWKLT